MKRIVLLLPVLTLILIVLPKTQAAGEPASTVPPGPGESPAQRDARMAWWREARFGMFVHWGLCSGLAGTWDGKPVGTRGGVEWIQERVKADTDTYAQEKNGVVHIGFLSSKKILWPFTIFCQGNRDGAGSCRK
jgi:hypothetical protein